MSANDVDGPQPLNVTVPVTTHGYPAVWEVYDGSRLQCVHARPQVFLSRDPGSTNLTSVGAGHCRRAGVCRGVGGTRLLRTSA